MPRTWLVTGASRGLGRHIVREAAGRGERVLACARDAAALEALACEWPAGQVCPVVIDLAASTGLGQALRTAAEEAGGIDVLVNNAGTGRFHPFLDTPEAELLQQLQVNLGAVVQTCYALMPGMLARGSGHIVNVGSDLARRPLAGMAAYVAAKHGLAGFSHSLLREFKGRGIKVSLINPGIIDTDFGGGREGSKEESWSLRPQVLAALIWQIVEQPGSAVIDELTVHPLGQGDF
jgi:short-subunit dehydrogenase